MNNRILELTGAVLLVLALAFGLFGTLLYTELGQLLNMPSEWLYGLYPHLGWISLLLIAVAVYTLVIHIKYQWMKRAYAVCSVVVLVGMVFVINYFVPYMWLRGVHHTAQYISVEEADRVLEDDMDMLVLEVDGEARGYPRDWMMLPHIAGDSFGEEHVTMTYCALSNLPLAFNSTIDGQQGDLKVVSQVHNNLVMKNDETGQLYQQITGSSPSGEHMLDAYPAQRMPWHAFKTLYPDGEVFHVTVSGPLAWLDAVTFALFDSGLEPHYNGPDPLFPTLTLKDHRLPVKEQVWGLNLGGEQVAYSRSYLEKNPLSTAIIGGQPVVVAWFDEYQTVGVFSRVLNGAALDVEAVDVHGNTTQGRLQRLPQYPHVFWMVWSHWFPDTKLMN